MELLIVLLLILLGATLVILEILVFPGINIAGFLGLASVAVGVYFGYVFFGKPIGHYVLAGTTLFGIGVTWYALRTKTWKKLSLHSKIEGSVEGVGDTIKEGDVGKTLGRLAPMGNVKIGDEIVEAESQSGYIDAGQTVEVIKVFKNKIIVKSKTD